MSERSASPRATMFADAGMLTVAAFAVTAAIEAPLFQLLERGGAPADVTEGVGSMIGFLAMLGFGVIGTWRLHGRKLTWRAGLGMFLGLVTAVVLAIALIQGIMLGIVRRFAGEGVEIWVALAVLGVLALAVLALFTRVVVRAVRDLRSPAPVQPTLDRYRLACGGIVLILAVVVGVLSVLFPDTEIAEAGIFALFFGVLGGAMVTGASMLAGPEEPKPRSPEAAQDMDSAATS